MSQPGSPCPTGPTRRRSIHARQTDGHEETTAVPRTPITSNDNTDPSSDTNEKNRNVNADKDEQCSSSEDDSEINDGSIEDVDEPLSENVNSYRTKLCPTPELEQAPQTGTTTSDNKDTPDMMKSMRETFTSQGDDLWLSFKAGVEDVVTLNRPSTFIFLYKDNASRTTEKLIERLAQYAVCNLRDCTTNPIVLTDRLLNVPEIVNDYGIILEQYKNELEDRGVMIVKNLEKVHGIPAQAFHSMCDEFTPLVSKSLFIFTMKIEQAEACNLKFIKAYLEKIWSDIKPDIFNALIVRITSMILEVNP